MNNQLISNDNIIVNAISAKDIKDLVEWLEKRKSINVTIVIQSIGNIVNSRLDSVNTICKR